MNQPKKSGTNLPERGWWQFLMMALLVAGLTRTADGRGRRGHFGRGANRPVHALPVNAGPRPGSRGAIPSTTPEDRTGPDEGPAPIADPADGGATTSFSNPAPAAEAATPDGPDRTDPAYWRKKCLQYRREANEDWARCAGMSRAEILRQIVEACKEGDEL